MNLRIRHFLATLILVLAGCGGGDQPAAQQEAKKKATAGASSTAAPSTNLVASASAAFRSTFSTNNAKDPFYPRSQPGQNAAAGVAAPAAQPAGASIEAAIRAGFQGIYGTPAERIALLHGQPLTQGKQVTINLMVDGRPGRVNVRVLSISRTVAELQVEGVPQVVNLTLQPK